jgi:hypothetical protein
MLCHAMTFPAGPLHYQLVSKFCMLPRTSMPLRGLGRDIATADGCADVIRSIPDAKPEDFVTHS